MMNMFLNNIYVSISRSSQTGIKKCTFSGVSPTGVKIVHFIIKNDLWQKWPLSGQNARKSVGFPDSLEIV